MAHRNPLGRSDFFRSPVRQWASDQLLPALLLVARGTGPVDVAVACDVVPPTPERAAELCYAAGWHHDRDGGWVKGSSHDPTRLVHRYRSEVLRVDAAGFDVRLHPVGSDRQLSLP
jgi:hypothetical protein